MVLHFGEYAIALDTKDNSANVNFVSHAHTDHTSGIRKNKKNIASDATKQIVECRSKVKMDMMDLPDGAQMLNAGHMLGSKQLYLNSTTKGYSVIYSGDYQMQKSPAAEKIETKQADILIIDSTYPYPNIEFEPKEEAIGTIQKYISNNDGRSEILFGAYTVGKSQELIKICNEISVKPFVSPNVARINKIYEGLGVKLDYNVYNDDNELKQFAKEGSVGIVEMHKLNEMRYKLDEMLNCNIYTAVATGFARMFKFDTDMQFALSDHADFKQATEYIDLCSPKMIYTCGSESATFAKNLKAEGYNAYPLGSTTNFNKVLLNYLALSHN